MHILNKYPEIVQDLESAVEWSYHSNMNSVDKANFIDIKDGLFHFDLEGNEDTHHTTYTVGHMMHTLQWYLDTYKNSI